MRSDSMPRAIPLLSALMAAILIGGCDVLDSNDDGRVDNRDVLATGLVNRTIKVTTQKALYLQNMNGDVEISRSPLASSVQIEAELIVGSDSRGDAERWLDKLRVRVEERDREVWVGTDFPDDSQGRRLEVRYRVGIPEGLDLEIRHVNGAIAIDDVVGHVDIEHVNGRVKINNLRGTTDVHLINGVIECHVFLDPNGFAFLNTVNGSINLDIPRNTSAKLHAGTTNGQVTFRDLAVANEVGNARERYGTMGGGNGQIELIVLNGDIDVNGM